MKDAAAPGRALELPASTIAAPGAPSITAHDTALDTPASLPRDHPAWQRDVLSVSARVRTVLVQLRPVVVRVLTFWDHAVRSVRVGGRRIEIDPSGCYRAVTGM